MLTSTLLVSKQLPNLEYSSTAERFDETWEAPLSTLLGLGRAAGADFVEFFLERCNYISCLAEEDAITSITPKLTTGAGVRVFRGDADCYVSTNDISFSGLKAALEKAKNVEKNPKVLATVPISKCTWHYGFTLTRTHRFYPRN